MSGWLPPCLRHEILHNRTVNLKGGKGKNLAMDRVNEFLNAEVKGMLHYHLLSIVVIMPNGLHCISMPYPFPETLTHAHGTLTENTLNRAGKIVGSLGRALDKIFQANVAETDMTDTYRKRYNYQVDIEQFVEDYKGDCLFDTIPGRQHESFPGFQVDVGIPKPDQLKLRLFQYSKRLDMSRKVLE
jgi:hypothetical protein